MVVGCDKIPDFQYIVRILWVPKSNINCQCYRKLKLVIFAGRDLSMNKVIFSTAYLPPIEYFVYLLNDVEIFIENDENYTRQTWRNRCLISGPNKIQTLTIPVIQEHGSEMHISKVRIDNRSRWQAVHWRSIEAAYSKSPFFMYYRDAFQPFYTKPPNDLLTLNMDLLKLCIELCGLKTKVNVTEKFVKEYPEAKDLRYTLSPKNKKHLFAFPRYPQVFEPVQGFKPNLSIIDLLFNRGPDSVDYLKSVLYK
jgi:hypothetical protein